MRSYWRASLSMGLVAAIALAPVGVVRSATEPAAPAEASAPAPSSAASPDAAATDAAAADAAGPSASAPGPGDPGEALSPAPAPAPVGDVAPAAGDPGEAVISPEPTPVDEATPAPSEVEPSPIAPEPPYDPQPARSDRGADALIGVGTTSLIVGSAALLFVAWPAWGLRNLALDYARQAELRADTAEYVDRAERRRNVAVTAFGIGTALAVGGIAMIAGGVTKRRRARSIAVTPTLGPGTAGASAMIRF